ncbi:MAG TPA: long-chain fatty acid--CoA ligase [Syntrophales bacterium]|nr:long-chain fatty acid--CoA ligase [Syntrophales bacterium]
MATYQEKPWLKSYEKGVPEFVKYEDICLPEMLDRSAQQFPNNTALIFQGTTVNFSVFKDMVDRFAACLTDFGIKKGDAVALLLPNTVPCVAAYYAILRIGGIAVMNNPLYSDPELEHQFNDSGSKVLVTLDALANRMVALRPKTKIKQIVWTCIGDYLSPVKRVLGRWLKKYPFGDVNPAPDVYRWKDCLAKYAPNPPKPKLSFDEIAMYQYTGGTTGVSKGVMLTHGNLSKQVQQLVAWFPKFEKGKEIMLGALPYFHVFGLSTAMNLSVSQGWAQILVPRPQPEPLLEAIKSFRPTFAPLVPTMYIGMLNHPGIKDVDMSCLKGAFSGSAPLPVEVIHDFEKLTGAVIVEGFGMTETTPVTHVNPFAGGARKVGSIGVPIPDTECRIVDLEDGVKDMPIGERGELIVKGPQIMLGYKGKPEETANTLKDGWIYTGDIATMDEDGYCYIVDRKKDMIISGGYNVYPRDIDEVYYENPKVQEACSIGIPDPKRGENVKLFIVLKEGQTATQEEMIEYGKTKLAAYKLPSEVEFRKELPKTNVGKVLRKELRAEELKKRGK